MGTRRGMASELDNQHGACQVLACVTACMPPFCFLLLLDRKGGWQANLAGVAVDRARLTKGMELMGMRVSAYKPCQAVLIAVLRSSCLEGDAMSIAFQLVLPRALVPRISHHTSGLPGWCRRSPLSNWPSCPRLGINGISQCSRRVLIPDSRQVQAKICQVLRDKLI